MALYDKSIILVPCVGTKIFQYQRRKDPSFSRKHFFILLKYRAIYATIPGGAVPILMKKRLGRCCCSILSIM